MFRTPQTAWLSMWAIAGLQLIAAPALAQPAAASDAPVPSQASDPRAAVPAALYRSPFTGYRAQAETAVAPWRDTNERVLQRGGWRAYAREASESASAPRSADLPAAAPEKASPSHGADHSGHRMK